MLPRHQAEGIMSSEPGDSLGHFPGSAAPSEALVPPFRVKGGRRTSRHPGSLAFGAQNSF